ncbi:tea1 [Symbiodinium sp. CCMP2456]|nr:tea1 [Symbiodinium sp. CCMP2456]
MACLGARTWHSWPEAFRRQDPPQHREPCHQGQQPRSILLGAAAAYCLQANPQGARRHAKPGFRLQVRQKNRICIPHCHTAAFYRPASNSPDSDVLERQVFGT